MYCGELEVHAWQGLGAMSLAAGPGATDKHGGGGWNDPRGVDSPGVDTAA